MTTQEPTSRPDSTVQHDDRTDGTPHVRVECYVRSVACSGRVRETVDRLQAQYDGGAVDELSIAAWPREVPLDGPLGDCDVVETFERLEAWANQWNVAVRPPFAVESREHDLAGRTGEFLVTPTVCLAVSVEGALVGAFPHETVDGTVGVEDALAAIEAGEVVANGTGRDAVDPAASADRCAICGTDLINGQGLYHCPECDRTVVSTTDGRRKTSTRDRRSVRADLDPRVEAAVQQPPAE